MGSVTFGLPVVFFFLEKEQSRRLREQNYTQVKSTMVFSATFQLKWFKKYRSLFFTAPPSPRILIYRQSCRLPRVPLLVVFVLRVVCLSRLQTQSIRRHEKAG